MSCILYSINYVSLFNTDTNQTKTMSLLDCINNIHNVENSVKHKMPSVSKNVNRAVVSLNYTYIYLFQV